MSKSNFQELNLSNSFLFPAALEDPITCRLILECIVEEPISELEVKVEYTKPYNSEFKCIRLDVYAKDIETEVAYNLEMQNRNEYNLPLRSRYYQAQLDMGTLKPGEEYTDLKPLYIIFICNFDPFEDELYRYTFSMQCEEKARMLNDGVKRIFLSTKGKNMNEVPQILVDFLGYLNDSTDTYVEQNLNEKVKEIHGRIKDLKKNRNVEKRYMHYLYVDRIIEEKENALKETEDALKETEGALKERENVLKEIESALKETEGALKETEGALKETEGALKETEGALKEAENAIRDMVFEALQEYGEISYETREFIKKENDIHKLKAMHTIAIKAGSIKEFENQIFNL